MKPITLPAPSVELTHQKTSREMEKGTIIRRHWFYMQKASKPYTLLVELVGADRNVLLETSSLIAKEQQYVYVDGPDTNCEFRYCTATLLGKSDTLMAMPTGRIDDLTLPF